MLQRLFKQKLIQMAALLVCVYLTACASPAERAEAMREQCDEYNRPRGMTTNSNCANLPAAASGKSQ